MLRDFVVALSLSNLWFFNVWRLFLIRHSSSYPYYHWKANPAPILLATVLDVLLLTFILWLAITLARRSKRTLSLRIARAIFLLMFFLMIAAFAIALLGTELTPIIRLLIKQPQLLFASARAATFYLWLWIVAVIAGWVLVTILIHKLLFRRHQLIKLAVAVVLILSPFVLVTFFQATWQWTRYRGSEQFPKDTVSPLGQKPKAGKRILWIVFDEMDLRLSFIDRPSTVKLPEFDRLRNEAVFAENAYPPSGDTALSLPSLITGQLVSKVRRTAPNELMLTFGENTQRFPWSSQPNVFSEARSMGFNTGLAGWYHPYCRIIGRSLTRCSWEAISFLPDPEITKLVSYSENPSVVSTMRGLGISTLLPDAIKLMLTGDGAIWRNYNLQSYANIHQQALMMASDPNLHLILVHYPIPHPPGVYDRSKQEFSLNPSSGYLDNLELSDRTLGDLRSEMEKVGLWETTTVLVSSDHGLRADRIWRKHPVWKPSFTIEAPEVLNSMNDERVPFIIRLAGEGKGLTYSPSFNTVVSRDLILMLLAGEGSNGENLVKWLDEHPSIAASPYLDREQ